jgi:hypothetical protein
MKYCVLLTLVLFAMFSCKSSNCTKSNKAMNTETISENNRLSPSTSLLIDELKREIGETEKDKTFIPSNDLIEKYGLKLKNEKYYVSGLIKVEDGFDEQILSNYDIQIRTKAGNIYTVNINVSELIKLSEIKTVLYIQIDEKINFK